MAGIQTSSSTEITRRFRDVRGFTVQLCLPLSIEDYTLQSMPDVSPTRWHIAHTTWFFETFVLQPSIVGYEPHDPAYEVLFNSYYNQVGQQFPRHRRGLLSRPSLVEVYSYRNHVDAQMANLLEQDHSKEWWRIVELGLHHEQQHQELILTDIQHAFSQNPLHPVYSAGPHSESPPAPPAAPPLDWLSFDGGIVEIGHEGPGFHFDNEGPRHEVLLRDFELSSRLSTWGEYLDFMEDGGYRRPELWLSDGWATVQQEGWCGPLYYHREGDELRRFSLAGLQPICLDEPVCHLSYFEADAFARWAGARLPTEQEWEHAAADVRVAGNFAESLRFAPQVAGEVTRIVDAADAASDDGASDDGAADEGEGGDCGDEHGLLQMYGDLWEWTSSAYTGYPGYAPPSGALGEYNGKFMCNQFVLRGGSCATSQSHIRRTYRNFFPPSARWQFTGVRLAR